MTKRLETVAIVGAGVGGLSLARALQHLPHTALKQVSVFERAHELRPALGGGFGITSAGIILCAKLGLATEFISSSNPMEYISQRDQDGSIYRHNVTQRDLRQYLTPDMFFEGQMCARMAMRDSLQKILVDSLHENTLHLNKHVIGIEDNDASGATLQFADGTSSRFDLVVGADGIRSTVRALVFGSYNPVFTNYRILYSVAKAGIRKNTTGTEATYYPYKNVLNMTCGAGDHKFDMSILTIAKSLERPPETWTNAGTKDILLSELSKLKNLNKEAIAVAEAAERYFDWGVYFHPFMNTWKINRVVLLGDACHATTPFAGQGANQAILDGFSLADKLQKFAMGEIPSIDEAIGMYASIRQKQTKFIVKSSGIMGFLDTCPYPWSIVRNKIYCSLMRR